MASKYVLKDFKNWLRSDRIKSIYKKYNKSEINFANSLVYDFVYIYYRSDFILNVESNLNIKTSNLIEQKD